MANLDALTASSLEALGDQYRAIAHNLANVNTSGYKRLRNSFAQYLIDQLTSDETSPPAGEISNTTTVDFSQGPVTRTGRPLDLAIEGEGLFVLETPEGNLYTRDGTFHTNELGRLVDSLGRGVAGEGGPVTVPSTVPLTTVQVGRDGTISAAGQTLGKLRLVKFAADDELFPVGGGAYRAPDGATPAAADAASVHQGFQESSNVNAVEEMVGLITVTRLYEANLKAVSVQDETMKNILQVALG